MVQSEQERAGAGERWTARAQLSPLGEVVPRKALMLNDLALKNPRDLKILCLSQ